MCALRTAGTLCSGADIEGVTIGVRHMRVHPALYGGRRHLSAAQLQVVKIDVTHARTMCDEEWWEGLGIERRWWWLLRMTMWRLRACRTREAHGGYLSDRRWYKRLPRGHLQDKVWHMAPSLVHSGELGGSVYWSTSHELDGYAARVVFAGRTEQCNLRMWLNSSGTAAHNFTSPADARRW